MIVALWANKLTSFSPNALVVPHHRDTMKWSAPPCLLNLNHHKHMIEWLAVKNVFFKKCLWKWQVQPNIASKIHNQIVKSKANFRHKSSSLSLLHVYTSSASWARRRVGACAPRGCGRCKCPLFETASRLRESRRAALLLAHAFVKDGASASVVTTFSSVTKRAQWKHEQWGRVTWAYTQHANFESTFKM